jgi:hypothetical protein
MVDAAARAEAARLLADERDAAAQRAYGCDLMENQGVEVDMEEGAEY